MAETTLDAARQLFVRFGDAAWLLTTASAPAGAAIYVCDVHSGRTLILPTAAGALQRLSAQVDVDETEYLSIRSATNVLLADLLGSSDIHADTRRGVIFGVALCIAKTRGFQITQHHGADVQHLLLRYPDAARRDHALTPMPSFKTHPIATTDLNATATHILLSEQLNFPERFAGDKPLGFSETRRNVLAGKK